MGQLEVNEDEVGINEYNYDVIAVGIRQKLVNRVYRDLRHLKLEKVARLAVSGIMGTPHGQNSESAYSRLQAGSEPCTMWSVHHWDKEWIQYKEDEAPEAVIRYMAATAVVAAMYDLVVCANKNKKVKAAA